MIRIHLPPAYRAVIAVAATWILSLSPLPAAEKAVSESFDSNGVKIAYFTQGTEGEPVVLIHGWLASAGINWLLPGISTKLAEDFQVIAMDVRGHGRSDKPMDEAAYGPELVEDVVRLLDHRQIKKAHIVGYSMGGIITANFVSQHPDRALSGTLGGMGWMKDGGLGQRGFAQIGKDDPNAAAFAVCGRSLAKLALTEEELKAIKVPMTVVVGDQDGLIQALYVDPLAKARGDWPIVKIPGGNHLNCIFKPQFCDEIVAWVKKNK